MLAIPTLKDIIDWYREHIKQNYQSGKDRFEKVFDPAYLDMIKINKDYHDMFSKILQTLPILSNEDPSTCYITKFDEQLQITENFVEVPVGSLDFKHSLASIKLVLDKDREANDFIRGEARALSTAIIKESKGFNEKNFSWQILSYFLDKPVFIDKRQAEIFFEDLALQGHHAMIDTPSYLISGSLLDTENVAMIRERITRRKADLSDRFAELSSAYYTLKLATYS